MPRRGAAPLQSAVPTKGEHKMLVWNFRETQLLFILFLRWFYSFLSVARLRQHVCCKNPIFQINCCENLWMKVQRQLWCQQMMQWFWAVRLTWLRTKPIFLKQKFPTVFVKKNNSKPKYNKVPVYFCFSCSHETDFTGYLHI